ncbi:MAG: LEA type 2 family protein [Steroidobacteraceae bacterium]
MSRDPSREYGAAGRGGPARAPLAAAAGLLALSACALMAACSLIMPKFQAPSLSVESIALERGDLLTQRLKVHLRVDNPNDRALPVKGLSYTLYVEGEQAAQGASDASFTVPALGQAEFDMHVTANMAGTLLRLLVRRSDARGEIEYRVVGKVELSRGLKRSIAFDHRGTFSLR